jgi:hypothetical protein
MRRNALPLSALGLILTLAMLPIAHAADPAAATVAGTNNKLRDPFAYDSTLIARDVAKIFAALNIEENNSPTSIGGGGTPRAPLALPFSK